MPRPALCARPRPPPAPRHARTHRHSSSAATPHAPPRTVFSGIQPTGIPHIGNYLGALSTWVRLQARAGPRDRLVFAVVGWHALTLPQDPAALGTARLDTLAVLLALGLDPGRSIVFFQEDNPDHTDLAWLLACRTPMGALRRITTWKTRLAVARHPDAHAGLFTYPVLQAADILAYRATHVPVGDDQRQHLELCRDLADAFNRTHATPLFPLPDPILTPSPRILSLRDPTAKMSKSAPDPASRILLTDPPDRIAAKLARAVTDSARVVAWDPVHSPGTANLLRILAACDANANADAATATATTTTPDPDPDAAPAALALSYTTRALGHSTLKTDLAHALTTHLAPFRTAYARLRADEPYLREVARDGAVRARALSGEVVREVRACVGLGG